jgi:hypothetical protein
VVGEAADGREAVELVRALAPAVVLMDIRMPNMARSGGADGLVEHLALRCSARHHLRMPTDLLPAGSRAWLQAQQSPAAPVSDGNRLAALINGSDQPPAGNSHGSRARLGMAVATLAASIAPAGTSAGGCSTSARPTGPVSISHTSGEVPRDEC